LLMVMLTAFAVTELTDNPGLCLWNSVAFWSTFGAPQGTFLGPLLSVCLLMACVMLLSSLSVWLLLKIPKSTVPLTLLIIVIYYCLILLLYELGALLLVIVKVHFSQGNLTCLSTSVNFVTFLQPVPTLLSISKLAWILMWNSIIISTVYEPG
jgi:hypothetical protein